MVLKSSSVKADGGFCRRQARGRRAVGETETRRPPEVNKRGGEIKRRAKRHSDRREALRTAKKPGGILKRSPVVLLIEDKQKNEKIRTNGTLFLRWFA